MTRGENTSKGFVWATMALFVIVYLACTSIVFQTAEREAREIQHRIIDDTIQCLGIELIVWDLLIMPLTLASLAKCFKRINIRFKGLLV